MSRADEFRARVKAAHDAIDEYAEDRLSGTNEWFQRDLDGKVRNAVEDVLDFTGDSYAASPPSKQQPLKQPRPVVLRGGPGDGLTFNAEGTEILVPFTDRGPDSELRMQSVVYRPTDKMDENGRAIFSPDYNSTTVYGLMYADLTKSNP